MSAKGWCVRHVVLIWGLLVFVSGMAIVSLDLQYDSGGVETLVYLFFEFLGQPVFVAVWLLGKLGMGVEHPMTKYAAMTLGLMLCVVVDLGIQMLLRRARAEAGASKESDSR